jgi:Tfp pilus assembly protein PilW
MLNPPRAEAGFALTELLAAMVIGMVIIIAAFALIDTSFSVNRSVAGRAEASQRGRLAMDRITRELRSQVCANSATPIVSADASQVTFTADLSNGSGAVPPDQRQLAYDSATGTITEKVWAGQGTGDNGITWNTTPKTSNVITESSPDPATTPSGAIFTYYAVTPGTGGTGFTQLSSTVLGSDLKRIARIDVAFVVRPPKTAATSRTAVNFEDSVIVRSVNPDSASPEASCPRL